MNPDVESVLHEVVARFTHLPVVIAANDMAVEVDHTYVIPAGVVASMASRKLALHRTGRRESKPIDIFLSSLAVERGEFSGGAILSGGDGDGTLGIKAVKEYGGITLAQTSDGHGPQHPSMPNTAISSKRVDSQLRSGANPQPRAA